jgi:hypothetical protein
MWNASPDAPGTDPPPTLVYDQAFHLKQILPCHLRRPKQVIQRDNVIAFLTLDPNAHTFDPRIREAVTYWSYACTMQLGDQEKICAALFRLMLITNKPLGTPLWSYWILAIVRRNAAWYLNWPCGSFFVPYSAPAT